VPKGRNRRARRDSCAPRIDTIEAGKHEDWVSLE
jgi:hypothetical protein